MTYTIVIPTARWETPRQDINDFLEQMIAAFQAVVPGVVRQFWSEIPPSFTAEGPLIYLGSLTETILHDEGLRTTTWTGSVGYVDTAPDNQEANTRANTFADYMRELFTANYDIRPPGMFQETRLTEVRASQGPGVQTLMSIVLEFTYVLMEGRV